MIKSKDLFDPTEYDYELFCSGKNFIYTKFIAKWKCLETKMAAKTIFLWKIVHELFVWTILAHFDILSKFYCYKSWFFYYFTENIPDPTCIVFGNVCSIQEFYHI